MDKDWRKDFPIGTRVCVNETFPYDYRGRTGTVIGLPRLRPDQNEWLRVCFDDNPKYPVRWHRHYFDVIDRRECRGDSSLNPGLGATGEPPAKDLALGAQQSVEAACVIDISRCPTLIAMLQHS